MVASRSLKTLVKRGALLTAANWPIVPVQFVAESILKLLVGVPIVGGFILLVLVVGRELPAASMDSIRDVGFGLLSALSDHPAGLAGFLASFVIAIAGGSILTFVVKAGTVSVLVEAERVAGEIERPPLRRAQLQAARRWSPEQFLEGYTRFGPRFVRLGLFLMAAYAIIGGAYLFVAFGLYRVLIPATPGWTAVLAGAASSALVVAISLANFIYLLIQMVIAADDVSVRVAAGRVVRFLRHDGQWVLAVFLVVLSLVIVGMGVSIVAAGALGLISFVPFVGFAVFPLQAVAWLLRGLIFQFIGFTALGSYLTLYRGKS